MIGVVIATVASAAVAAGAVALQGRGRRAALESALERETKDRLAQVEAHRAEKLKSSQARAQKIIESTAADLDAEERRQLADIERIERLEVQFQERAAALDERESSMSERFDRFKARRDNLRGQRDSLNDYDKQYDANLEAAAGTTRQEVLDTLRDKLKNETYVAVQKAAKALEEGVLAHREQRARRVIDIVCQRYGVARKTNRLIAAVDLPRSDKLATQVQADGGAFLQAITAATEVEFIPRENGQLYMNAPDPFIREIGRLTYERLVRAGNVRPDFVAKAAAKATKDLEKTARDAGNKAAKILRVRKMHPEILYLVGKLLYRTSYTQNQWQHAIETAELCGMMARELGVNARDARRAALIHDIGKVLWAETEAVGSHAVSGAAFATEHGELPEIVHPVAAHHADEKPSTPLAHLVAAADALSGARPGARRETLESYGQRVESLEAICAEFNEIRKSYIIQGGREVRILVDPRQIDDVGAVRLSNEVAHRIEDDLVYPGQIKVTVLRETRSSAVAR